MFSRYSKKFCPIKINIAVQARSIYTGYEELTKTYIPIKLNAFFNHPSRPILILEKKTIIKKVPLGGGGKYENK